MNLALIATGLAGLSASTWVFPWLARLREPRPAPRPEDLGPSPDFEILIPAHNEAAGLGATIDSISRAVERVRSETPGARVRIWVGADACDDDTAAVARAHGAEVEEVVHRSKWRTLVTLTELSRASRLAWVDAGTLWPEELLLEVARRWPADGLGVAVAYRPRRPGLVQRTLWSFEVALKHLENMAGGPVSVHGATVFYDAASLRRELPELKRRDWRNDDIVVPYALRARYPQRPLVYLTDVAVDDAGVERGPSDTNRRMRLVEGNVEIYRAVFREGALPRQGAAPLLLSRRMARALWAWWILAIATGTCPALGALALATALLTLRRPLGAAFFASLAAPALVIFTSLGRRLPWT